MNKYFEELTDNAKDFFKKLNFEPESDYDANNFLKSYYQLELDKKLVCNFKKPIVFDKKQITELTITSESFFDCFHPKIWKQLGVNARLLACFFAYKNILNRDIELKDYENQFIFAPSIVDHYGEQGNVKGEIQMFLSFDLILFKNSNPLFVLNTIAHELYHSKQTIMIDNFVTKFKKLNKSGKKINFDGFDEYYLDLLSYYDGNEWQYLNGCVEDEYFQDTLLLNVKFAPNSRKNTQYLNYWFSLKDDMAWKHIIYIAYINCALETGAFNKGAQITNQVIRYLEKKYGKISKVYLDVENDKIKKLNDLCIKDLKKLNYNISAEDLTEFKKLNKMISSEVNGSKTDPEFVSNEFPGTNFFKSKTWFGITYLLDIHKNKCLTQKIDTEQIEQLRQNKKEALNIDTESLIVG